MTTKIQIKRSTTAASVPTTSDLDTGELAVNTADKRLFTEDPTDGVVELGTNPSSLDVAGNVDVTGNLDVDGTTTLDDVTATGTIDLSTGTTSVATPTTSAHAATKGYVDQQVNSVDVEGGTITAVTITDLTTTNAITANGGLTGSVTGNVTGNVTGTVSDVSNHDTDDISEGTTNLYYTDERVDDRVNDLLTAGTNVTLTYDDDNGTLTIDAPDTTTDVVDDTTPQLGGDLDLNSSDITGTGNINITGTVTADGLTVDTGGALIQKGEATGVGGLLQLKNTSNTTGVDNGNRIEFISGNNDSRKVYLDSRSTDSYGRYPDFVIGSETDSSTERDRVKIAYNGDISFYEDTGTTAKFFWDAADERLGIGTSSFYSGNIVQATNARDSATRIGADNQSNTANALAGIKLDAYGGGWSIDVPRSTNYTNPLKFSFGADERMRIDSSGNVGIGTSSPATHLEVEADSGAQGGTVDNPVTIRLTDTASSQSNTTDTTNPYAKLEFYSRDTSNEGPIAQAYIGAVYDDVYSAGGELSFATWNQGSSSASEAMRIRSNGKVGIGTSEPIGNLEVAAEGDTRIRINDTRNNSPAVNDPKGGLDFYWSDNSGNFPAIAGSIEMQAADVYGSQGDMVFKTNSNAGSPSEAMRIDATGKVGIGTDSPSSKLDVDGGAITVRHQTYADGAVKLNRDLDVSSVGAAGVSLKFGAINSGSDVYPVDITGVTDTDGTAGWLSVNLDGSEAMRIDSSGNLLVGKTTTSNATAGAELNASGQIVGTFASGTHILGRNTNDGSILEFQKDGSTVGSIGNFSGTSFLTVGNTTGLALGSNGALPWNATNNTTKDGLIDLGSSGQRWKDLYLSGGVYLGGTTSSNHLDDYEEGTWTPTASGGTITYSDAKYVKVGKLVVCSARINCSSTTTGDMGGLPFTAEGTGIHSGSVGYHSVSSDSWVILCDGGTGWSFRKGSGQQQLTSGTNVRVTITYHTTA